MCGIAGYVSPNIREGAAVLNRMNGRMIHRGPDDSGIYTNGVYGFGMRRLSIIDLKAGRQPIWNEDQTVGIVFNGEIYNYRELREQLAKKGHRFQSASDTEVIVHLYEEKGADCLGDLNGMFAFALYDRNRDEMFLARDRMGEKPLHYYHAGEDFAFASEIKSLLAFPGIEARLSLKALNMYLTYEYVPAPYTIYENIFKLEPAHFMIFKRGELKTAPYWRTSFQSFRKKAPLEEVTVQLRDRIKRSVAMRTVSDVPLGAFLSGGIDSSLITYFLTQVSSQRVKTFSIAFDEPSFDESSYAREIAGHLGTEHHEERLNGRTMLDILPDIVRGLDEPLADGSLLPTYLLSEHTRRFVTVALSGDGGDELFAGYPTYAAHKVARWIPRFMGAPLRFLADRLPVSDENISLDFQMRRFTAGLSYETPLRNQIWLGAFSARDKNQLFSLDVREALKGEDEFELLKKQWNRCEAESDLNRVLNLDMRFYLQDDILVKVDRMSMANSLEVRAPFLDHELVEFVCGIKPSLKLKGLTTKYILKQAAKGILPERIIRRPKKGFGAPIAKWLKADLQPLFRDLFEESKVRREGLFNSAYIHRLLSEHKTGRRDHRKLLWPLVVFQMWKKNVPDEFFATGPGKIPERFELGHVL